MITSSMHTFTGHDLLNIYIRERYKTVSSHGGPDDDLFPWSKENTFGSLHRSAKDVGSHRKVIGSRLDEFLQLAQ